MKPLAVLALLLPLAFTLGCPAPVRVTSFTDPAYVEASYSRILVFAEMPDLEARRAIENAFVAHLRTIGVEAIAAYDVLVPTRAYDPEMIREQLQERNMDSLLRIMVMDIVREEVVVDPALQPQVGYGAGRFGSGMFFGATYSPGRRYTRTAEVRLEVKLIDAETGETAWVSTAVVEGDRDALRRIAEATVARMQEDGILAPNRRRAPPTPDD